jgi:hypothetical protein
MGLFGRWLVHNPSDLIAVAFREDAAMGYLDPDFGMICVPKRRWRMRMLYGLMAVFLFLVLSFGVACALAAVTVVVVAAFGQAIGEALGSLFSLAMIFTGVALVAGLYAPFIFELLGLLATGQVIPFVLRLIRLLCGS